MLPDDCLPIGGYPDGVKVPSCEFRVQSPELRSQIGTLDFGLWTRELFRACTAKELPPEISLGALAPEHQVVKVEKSGEVRLAEPTHMPGCVRQWRYLSRGA